MSRGTPGPDRATVSLRATDRLELDVTDEGGSVTAWEPGVGIASMRERAAELGGELVAGPGPRGGTVRAVLPLG